MRNSSLKYDDVDRLTVLALAYHLGVSEKTARKYIVDARAQIIERYREIMSGSPDAFSVMKECD